LFELLDGRAQLALWRVADEEEVRETDLGPLGRLGHAGRGLSQRQDDADAPKEPHAGGIVTRDSGFGISQNLGPRRTRRSRRTRRIRNVEPGTRNPCESRILSYIPVQPGRGSISG